MKALKYPLIIFLCLTVIATQVSAAYPPSIYLYDLPATASYTIKTDGTNYWYVRTDGFTYSSTNAFYVINLAIDATAADGGGLVMVTAGTYLSTVSYPTIQLKRHVSLLGEGMNQTIFKCGSGVSRTVMYCAFKDGDDYDSIEIGNFKIDGNKANNANTTAYGIHVFALMRARFHDMTIINTCSTAFFTQGNLTQSSFLNTYENLLILWAGESGYGYGMYFTNYCQDNVLTDLKVAVSVKDGIYFSSSGNREISNSHIWQNGGRGIYFLETIRDKMVNVEIEKNDYEGVKIHSCYDFTMIGCTINSNGDEGDNLYPEVMIDCDSAVSGVNKYGYNNIISSNHIWDRGPDATYSSYCLMMNNSGSGYVGNLTVIGNDFGGSYSHGIISYAATGGNCQFIGNNGFITENTGSHMIGAASNTTCTFNHGLFTTPTFVSASFNATGYASWRWNASSSKITLTVQTTVNAIVYWQAVYKP